MNCTCHPDEAPVPCQRKYAFSECLAAAKVRDAVIEECAVEIEQARMAGQKYYWWGAFWTYFNDPFPNRDKLAAMVRSLKAQHNS